MHKKLRKFFDPYDILPMRVKETLHEIAFYVKRSLSPSAIGKMSVYIFLEVSKGNITTPVPIHKKKSDINLGVWPRHEKVK
mmetsp:Transcript_7515/g.11381  ORF Transcript_7515/g.11381 Transcript_7515/m.11381 type:complete len:81 (+) Transcript_7515:29-271(+)